MNLLEKNLEKFGPLDVMNVSPNGFAPEDTAFQRYTRRFNQFIPPVESLSDAQKECLNEFGKAMEHYDKLLTPFRQQGINYTIGLGGGALRDFLLGNIDQIKDLDLFVCFEDDKYQMVPEPFVPAISKSIAKNILGEEFVPDTDFYQAIADKEQQFKDKYSKDHTQTVNLWIAHDPQKEREKADQHYFKMHDAWIKWRDNEFNKDALTEVCMRLLDKTENVTGYYSNKNSQKEIVSVNPYLNDQMYGNIKLQSSHLKYPVDLVICKHPALPFSASFDFAICKVVCNYSDNQYSDEQVDVVQCFNPEKALWQNVYENILATPTFLKDLADNTVSINIRNFTKEHIDYFMDKHFLKLKEKYPERQLKMYNTVDPDLKEYFDIVFLNANLDADLPLKDGKSTIKRKI
jgi:hypothetical protein